ncbi:hsp70 nucleotide exchange factor fes1 [Coemansia sp. RSA 2322]|uniref:Hsp70 nucleotide exchange factor fes1 n=1 Tax=Coemansia thaxteri TaxID=2663907 RepID=A0A9W8BHM3_9FUNG|nr:hsp70 nucleotide exchange factor fes1 [Coemansia thaxteri]KAJ2464166.1 hsp70 nucleotide exchange factor fes1 [Coemansia sp. RSA 2322]KAJ2470528.1 hsp70 nucleotide exchange factor fes1 [Coemansia sp. RSA 2320]
MNSLLKWAILNGATAGEDAPGGESGRAAPQALDPAVIDMILGKPASVQMSECMDAVEHAETPAAARAVALDDLEMLVENIDNAANVEALGLWPRLQALYTDGDAGVRAGALWVSATALQHNPRAQAAFGARRLARPVLRVLQSDGDAAVRAKALLCLSAYVRANAAGLADFVAADGLQALHAVLGAADPRPVAKALFLLRALIDDDADADAGAERRLPPALADLRFADAAAAAALRFADSDPPTADAARDFVAVLAATH